MSSARGKTAAIMAVVKSVGRFKYVPGCASRRSDHRNTPAIALRATMVARSGGVARKGAAELSVAADRREC